MVNTTFSTDLQLDRLRVVERAGAVGLLCRSAMRTWRWLRPLGTEPGAATGARSGPRATVGLAGLHELDDHRDRRRRVNFLRARMRRNPGPGDGRVHQESDGPWRTHAVPYRRDHAHDERAQRHRDRLLPDLPRRLARPRRARQDHRALAGPRGAGPAAPAGTSRSRRYDRRVSGDQAMPSRPAAPPQEARRAGSASCSTDHGPPADVVDGGRAGRPTPPGRVARDRVEYVEVARAESERGELVLRERRPVDGGPTSLELRANGVFVMDTVEVSTERAMAHAALALVEEPRAVRGRRAGARLHDARGAGRLPGREVRGGGDRAGAGRVDARRAGAGRAGAAGRRAGDRRGGRHRDRRCAEAGEASYDLVLLDVDNGPGYLVHAANAALYEPPALTDARRVLRPGGALVVWSAAEAPELEESLRDGVRRRRGPAARRTPAGAGRALLALRRPRLNNSTNASAPSTTTS